MIEKCFEKSGRKINLVEFTSLYDFTNYILGTEYNGVFRNFTKKSIIGKEKFCGTASFEEAMDLFKNGWSQMAENLQKRLVAKEKQVVYGAKQKTIYDVAGFQASVPRYLQGIPTNMINKKSVPVKQKVITVSKEISYSWQITTEQIIEESVKALMIVKKLEAQGLKVNLNILFIAKSMLFDGEVFAIKVKIKNANERLNVSKLAFPLVNPSMLRRLFFRFIEVYPRITEDFKYGYGVSIAYDDIKYCLHEQMKDEYVLPAFFTKKVESIEDMESFKA